MEITITWYWLLIIIFLAVWIPWISSKAHKKDIEELKRKEEQKEEETIKNMLHCTRTDANTVVEVKNMIDFLKERDKIIAFEEMKNDMRFEKWRGKPLDCDYDSLKKGTHPALLAFVRAAHLAGCSVSIREKGYTEEEQKINAETFISEFVTKITRQKVEENKKYDEKRDKISRFGYYK